MIYSSALFALLLGSFSDQSVALSKFPMTTKQTMNNVHTSPLYAVPEWLTEPTTNDGAENSDDGMITVRFINTVNQRDVVCKVQAGSNLLAIGDAHGVKLPRACRTGLCGSCTCEVKDPQAIKTDTNPRDGFATIRACSAKCFVPDGEKEMVIDVYRMQNKVVSSSGTLISNPSSSPQIDPMARFSGNWEKEFRPSWDIAAKAGGGQVGGASNPLSKTCKNCNGTGRCECYTCRGTGRVTSIEGGQLRQCSLCVGLQTIGCSSCRGTGIAAVKKKLSM